MTVSVDTKSGQVNTAPTSHQEDSQGTRNTTERHGAVRIFIAGMLTSFVVSRTVGGLHGIPEGCPLALSFASLLATARCLEGCCSAPSLGPIRLLEGLVHNLHNLERPSGDEELHDDCGRMCTSINKAKSERCAPAVRTRALFLIPFTRFKNLSWAPKHVCVCVCVCAWRKGNRRICRG